MADDWFPCEAVIQLNKLSRDILFFSTRIDWLFVLGELFVEKLQIQTTIELTDFVILILYIFVLLVNEAHEAKEFELA